VTEALENSTKLGEVITELTKITNKFGGHHGGCEKTTSLEVIMEATENVTKVATTTDDTEAPKSTTKAADTTTGPQRLRETQSSSGRSQRSPSREATEVDEELQLLSMET
jgi:hypothetical protein